MNCPRCQGGMQTKKRNDIELDVCPSCGGVWFDKGEVDKVIEAELEHHGLSEKQNWRQYDRGRDGYDSEPPPARAKSFLETLVSD